MFLPNFRMGHRSLNVPAPRNRYPHLTPLSRRGNHISITAPALMSNSMRANSDMLPAVGRNATRCHLGLLQLLKNDWGKRDATNLLTDTTKGVPLEPRVRTAIIDVRPFSVLPAAQDNAGHESKSARRAHHDSSVSNSERMRFSTDRKLSTSLGDNI